MSKYIRSLYGEENLVHAGRYYTLHYVQEYPSRVPGSALRSHSVIFFRRTSRTLAFAE